MKPLLIVANFKSHFTKPEAEKWLSEITNHKSQITNHSDKKVVVCPSFTLLQTFNEYIKEHDLPLEIGAQNVSRLPPGAYTGEVNAEQIKEFADYVIIGHSERRKNFSEDESVIEEKIKMAKDYGLTSILCVRNENDRVYSDISIVVYEPIFAIGTGNPDTPENAEKVAEKIKEKVDYVLYGGSVTGDNVKSFTRVENIDGVLVGHESLDPFEFLNIVKNA